MSEHHKINYNFGIVIRDSCPRKLDKIIRQRWWKLFWANLMDSIWSNTESCRKVNRLKHDLRCAEHLKRFSKGL